jgi:hypothetical protein
VAHDNTNDGFSGTFGTHSYCISYGNGNDGFSLSGTIVTHAAVLVNCVSALNAGDGVYIDRDGDSRPMIMNSIIARNGGYGINASGATICVGGGNLIPGGGADANTSGALHNVTFYDEVLANLTGSQLADFVSVTDGSENFALGATSAARAAGWPGALPVGGTGYIDIGALQHADPTLPVVGDVQDGVFYGVGGTQYEGTLVVPAVGDVQDGVSYGANGTEYEGTFEAPSVSDVRNSIRYGAGGAEYEGTFIVPGVNYVLDGVDYGAGGTEYEGTLTIPTYPVAADVLSSATAYGPLDDPITGTYHAPDVGEVIDSAVFGPSSATSGTYHAPDVGEVIDTAVFGPASATSGTYHAPDVGEVIDSAVFGPSSATSGTFAVPAVEDVQDGVFYGADGTEYEGTFAVPAEADVLDGVGYGAGDVEYEGELVLPTYPVAADVLSSATAYGPLDDPIAGTYHAPSVGEVIDSAVFGPSSATSGTYHAPDVGEVIDTAVFGPASATSGTFAVPAEADVQDGVGYGAGGTEYEGELALPTYPAVADVLSSAAAYGPVANPITGTYHAPSVDEVIDTAVFGPASAISGTYHAPSVGEVIDTAVFGPSSGTSGTFAVPAVGDVQDGVDYGASGTQYEGTFSVPAESNVLDGVGYGAGGTEYEGTYVPVYDYPDEGDVQDGVSYGSGGYTGTFVVPAEADVKDGVQYGADGTEYEGTLVGGGENNTYPPIADVLDTADPYGPVADPITGIYHAPSVGEVIDTAVFGPSSGTSGTFAVPAEADVKDGVGYGADGIEFEGEYFSISPGTPEGDNPFSLVLGTLWDLVMGSTYLQSIVPLRNRLSFNGIDTSGKDQVSTADFPEVRIVPVGGSASLMRSSSSSTTSFRFAIQVRTAEIDVNVMTSIRWAVFSALSAWPSLARKLRWNGQTFITNVGDVQIQDDLTKVSPASVGDALVGWATLWTGECSMTFTTQQLQEMIDG